jgi:hypothetical protein
MKYFIYVLCILLAFSALSLPAATIGLTLPDTNGVSGDLIDVPVRIVDDMSGEGIIAYQLQINFTNSRLQFIDAITSGTFTESLGSYSANQTAANQIKVSSAGSIPLSGKGDLIVLRFKMIASGTATLAFTDTLNNFFNEGTPSVNLQNGRVVITNPPIINVNPNSGLLAIGETLNFSVSGGTAPYNWSLSNPISGTITSTGTSTAQFTAVQSGFTRVIAQDDNGIIDSTNSVIEIRPIALDLPDSVISQGQTVDIPILISDLSGLGIISGQFTLSFSGTIFSGVGVITTGTMLNSYSNVSFNSESGKALISFAGTTVLAGSGVLCYVRLESNFNSSGNSNLTLSDVVFNEGILAKLYGGSCRVNSLPALVISPSTATLFTGDTLRFSVTNGGMPPLVWSTSNPDIATISDDGLLTTVTGGQVSVNVTDAANASGTSGSINIYDTQITIPDTSATISGFVDVPVYIDAIRSSDMVYSVQGTFSYNANILTIVDVLTEGTIGIGWAYAAQIEENEIIFAGAGASGTRAAGKIATLRFLVNAGVNNGARGSVTFNDVLLNEGRPVALVQAGSVTANVSEIPPMPELISPTEGAGVPPEAANFLWTRSIGTQNYHIQIDTGNDFSAPVVDNENVADTLFTAPILNDLTTYFWRVRAGNVLGISDWSAVWSFQTTVNNIEQVHSNVIPTDFKLGQNYPNPFNPVTNIEFSIPKSAPVQLEIYNALGKRIDVLVDNSILSAGTYRVQWNAARAASGVYYYRLQASDFSMVKRMLLIQ